MKEAKLIVYICVTESETDLLKNPGKNKAFGFTHDEHLYNKIRKCDSLKKKTKYVTLFKSADECGNYLILPKQLNTFLNMLEEELLEPKLMQSKFTRFVNDLQNKQSKKWLEKKILKLINESASELLDIK